MLEDLTDRLRGEGLRRLELVVVGDNPRAIQFYKRHGFEVEGVMKDFLKRGDSDEYLEEVMIVKMLW